MTDRFSEAIRRIDAINRADPNQVTIGDRSGPKELVHSELMSEWLERLDPDHTEDQAIAARAHHLRRWALARSDYAEGRAGYLRWRRDQKTAHAAETAQLLTDVGYEVDFAERVGAIIAKVGLASDPAVQTHEDALCLVFLEHQLTDFASRFDPVDATRIVQKTLVKMTPHGRSRIRGLTLDPTLRSLLDEMVASLDT